MKKTYTLKGLDCPHCATEIEEEVAKLSGISSANVNLIKQVLTVEVESNFADRISEHIINVVHTHEPDVEVSKIIKKSSNSISVAESNIKTFTLRGLDCPHCATEIEEEVAKLSGITSANVNLIKQTLTVEVESSVSDRISENIINVVHTHEPDVEVFENKSNINIMTQNNKKKNNYKLNISDEKKTVIRFAFGAVFFVIGFVMSHFTDISLYIQLPVLLVSYVILGGDVLLKAVRNIAKGRVFDENFLMTVSTLGAFVIGEYSEAVAVMLFYQVGEFFQGLAVKKSRKSIADLMDIRPDYANVKRNGEIVTVSPDEIEIGETIIVKPGEKLPLDGVVIDGESMLDTKALTGESVPKKATIGDNVLSGCINKTGVLSVRVTKHFEESTASKIIDLVENAAARKAPTENFITTFSKYYTPIVVILATLLAVIPPLVLGGGWSDWIHRGFVFLVISCPCALVISIPLTFFGGIGAASKKGVLVKGSNYLEALNYIESIVFDKTGTLTKGVFKVTDTFTAKGFSKEQLIEFGAKTECMSNHPIARSVIEAYGKDISKDSIKNYTENSGYGVSAEIDGKKVLVGNEKLMIKNNIKFDRCNKAGTTVYIAINGKFAGYMVISDEVKSDSKSAIARLKDIGIDKAIMLTGDNKQIAKSAAEEIGLDEYYGELLPDQKVEMLEKLEQEKNENSKVAFVGDGINDAPVLARADIGIAMGGLGSDAAIEAADVVLMTDEPSKLIDAISVAKYTKKIVTQNIVIVLTVKILFLILGAFGIAGMWEAVFGDVGVMIIAVINAMRILRK